jgi:putative ABC transport system permease protein
LVGALLLVRTMHNLYTANTGLDMKDVAYVGVSARLKPGQADAVHRSVVSAVQAVPGVETAGLGQFSMYVVHSGEMSRPDAPGGPGVPTGVVPVTPGWFRVFHVAALRGRVLDEEDWSPDAPTPVSVVVTESLSRRLSGKADPVGRTVVLKNPAVTLPARIVGVIPDIASLTRPSQPSPNDVFISDGVAPKLTGGVVGFTVVFRAHTLDPPLLRRIRSATEEAMPDEPIPEPARASDMVALFHANQVMLGHLLLLLAGLAALLAAVGLYGIIAFVVAGRRREFGVRIALGAEASRIAGLVFRYGAVIVGAGTAFGLGGAYVLSGVLRNQLFGVGSLDPASYYGGAAVLALVAALACWVPARRATHVDPVETLREE